MSPAHSSKELMKPALLFSAPRWHPNTLHPEGERLEAFHLKLVVQVTVVSDVVTLKQS